MTVEILLAMITLMVAVIGTLLRDPHKNVKIFLIVLAAVASIGSIVKAVNDDSDKEFMKTALMSTLKPSNSVYERLTAEVDESAKTRGFEQNAYCIHYDEGGMTCFLHSATEGKQGTLVFNKAEIAEMYANQIRRENNKKMIDAVFRQTYSPDDLHEEFVDKIGLLGFAVFFNVYGRFPSDYNYDGFGVRVDFEEDGKKQSVGFSPAELTAFEKNQGPAVFYAFEQTFRKKFAELKKQ